MARLFFNLVLAGACALHALAGSEEYDFVIVGGGLAGCVLANRLSASGEHSVLLLNVAGAPPRAYSGPVVITDEFIISHNITADDGLRARIGQPGYKPVPHFSTSETGSSPARMLGGSSLVALSLYLRDDPEALDSWGEGWSWEELRPYFKRAEGLQGSAKALKESDYGQEGPFTIQETAAYTHPLTDEFIRAARSAGLPWAPDLNTEKGTGVGFTPTFQRADGTKVHAYDAYLYPALKRSNLKVLTGARADRLIIKDGERVEGVAYRNFADDSDHVVYARREVVLASGYIYSPRLLFLSGIGCKAELEAVGLLVVKDLPAVGHHLTAARFSPLAWTTAEPTLAQLVGPPISEAGGTTAPESYGSAVLEATARVRSKAGKSAEPKAKRADIVLSFMPLYYAPRSAPLQYSLQGEPWPLKTKAYTILATLGETKAKGSVTFPSGSPDRSPVVTHEAMTHPEDLEKAKEAVLLAKRIGGSANFSQPTAPVENGAGAPDMWTAVYDGRGTCRMGKDARDSVVDYELRVHGLKGVRIVDGSVIPVGSPYLAVPEVLAVAERGADLLLNEYSKQHQHQKHTKKSKGRGEKAEVETIHPFSGNDVTIANLTKILGRNFTIVEAIVYLSGEQEQLASTPAPSAAGAKLFVGVAAAAVFAAVLALAARRAGSEAQGEGRSPLLA